MKKHLFVLGRNFELSRAELRNFCEEIETDRENSLLLAKNLKFENPRSLPKTPEQILLDRLGGVIRFAEVIAEDDSTNSFLKKICDTLCQSYPEGRLHVGVSAWGMERNFLREFLPKIKTFLKTKYERDTRVENPPGENLDSGRIFHEKLLRKGHEFLIWKNGPTIFLAKTVANQNLRNYTLRDRGKDFRDPRMGMLPPKLAQILINLANPSWDETVVDPFCGSGTVNIEAAIDGFRTMGSDIDAPVLKKAQENFLQMAEKFRYDPASGVFQAGRAEILKLGRPSVIVTEGFLGHNFTRKPSPPEIQKQASDVLGIWEAFFWNLEKLPVRKVAICLPCWGNGPRAVSISAKLFAKISKTSYTPEALFGTNKTFVYSRPDSFVSREICVFSKKK